MKTATDKRGSTAVLPFPPEVGSGTDLSQLSLRSINSLDIGGMRVANYSAESIERLMSWLPRDLRAEEVVFFPDACPGRSPLPTGCAVRTNDPGWRKLAVSDCGCGMQLLKSGLLFNDFPYEKWDDLGRALQKSKGGLGDLGGGNHFLDAMVSYADGGVFFLIHTGSRLESGAVDELVDQPRKFDREFSRVVDWARDNRTAVAESIRKHFGECELVCDIPHNTYEMLQDGGVILRKGAVRAFPGECVVLPSSMSGDIALLEATEEVGLALNSLSHGTGRTMSRGEARDQAATYDFGKLRSSVYIPEYIENASLRTEAPFCYRGLDACLSLLGGLVKEQGRFAPIAYLGHL